MSGGFTGAIDKRLTIGALSYRKRIERLIVVKNLLIESGSEEAFSEACKIRKQIHVMLFGVTEPEEEEHKSTVGVEDSLFDLDVDMQNGKLVLSDESRVRLLGVIAPSSGDAD